MRERLAIFTRPRAADCAPTHDDADDAAARERLLATDDVRGRWWRLIGLAWLLVLIDPIVQLFRDHQSPLHLAVGLVGGVTFIAFYFWMLFSSQARALPPSTGWWIAFTVLTIEAVTLNLIFHAAWIGLFFFISVSAGRASPRIAIWLIGGVSIATGIIAALAHFTVANTGLLVIEVGLIGAGMIGIFQTIRVNRDLRVAREELARRAVAEERLRFARELHDSVTQELFSMTLHARTTLKSLDRAGVAADDPLREQVQVLNELAQSALAEMRMLIFELRPGALAEESLTGAVRKLAASISAREKIVIDVDAPPERLLLAHATEEHLYRIIQEALNNVVKHARARRAVVRIAGVERDAGLVVEVHDDGKGFDTALMHPGHMGLETMGMRANEMGGDYTVRSAPGDGTTVRVTVPLADTPSARPQPIQQARSLLSR